VLSSISGFEISESYSATSETAIERRHVVLLLAALMAVCVLLEAGTMWWSRSLSTFGRIVDSQYREALSLRHGGVGEPLSMLIVGNSTLRHGISVQDLNGLVQPDLNVHVFVVDSTTYEDWRIGLERLFRKGAHPDFVVLMLAPGAMAMTAPPPDAASRYLFGPREILTLGEIEGIGPTLLSNIFFAHYSAFFGRRTGLRLGIKRAILPHFEIFARRYMILHLKPDHSAVPKRFREFGTLCRQYSVNCLYVIPPTDSKDDSLATARFLQTAESAGIHGAAPLEGTKLGEDKYIDGYHLNERGQKIFTAAVANYLKGQICPKPWQ
jgi:hypothetical protein